MFTVAVETADFFFLLWIFNRKKTLLALTNIQQIAALVEPFLIFVVNLFGKKNIWDQTGEFMSIICAIDLIVINASAVSLSSSRTL